MLVILTFCQLSDPTLSVTIFSKPLIILAVSISDATPIERPPIAKKLA